MRPMRIISTLGAAVLLSCSREKPAAPADIVLRGGAVYTVDAARSWASAVAVRDGRIIYVGTDSVPAALVGPATEVVELAGAMVLPGFQDAHVHPVIGGAELGECHVTKMTTVAVLMDSIRSCARGRPELPWVRGGGWQLPLFPAANPPKALLDQAVPDRPAAFEAMDGHSLWVNSRALALAGITRDTPDPPNGRIERDPRTREPSGTLREGAMDLVYEVLPERTEAELSAGLERAQREANRFGITSVFAADEGESELETYTAADRAERLSLRVVAATSAGEGDVDSVVARARILRTRFTTPHVHPIAVKLYQDGVVESRTAAMLAPYLDRRGDAGTPNYDQPTLDSLAAALDREGFQIHVHAIGDRAIRMALDAFEYARKQNGVRDSRHSIAHLQVIDPADIPRFRALGVVANFEAFWANGDEYLTVLADPALGPRRSRWRIPDRECGAIRSRGFGRERLVGLVAQPARRHPGGHDPPADRQHRRAMESRGAGGPRHHDRALHHQRRLRPAAGPRNRVDRGREAGGPRRPRPQPVRPAGRQHPHREGHAHPARRQNGLPMKHPILGLHHVTATVAEAKPDLDFFAGALGLRLVKRTVNFDNHNVYHFYYGDERGAPGTIWTTFPYAGWGVPVGTKGEGQITVTSFSVPAGSLAAWKARLGERGLRGGGVRPRRDPVRRPIRAQDRAGRRERPALSLAGGRDRRRHGGPRPAQRHDGRGGSRCDGRADDAHPRICRHG